MSCIGNGTASQGPTAMKQRSFASAEFAMKKKLTRREKFLAEMEKVVPWPRLIAAIEPHYPTSGRVGRQPIGAEWMLRMYCLQQCCRPLPAGPKRNLTAGIRRAPRRPNPPAALPGRQPTAAPPSPMTRKERAGLYSAEDRFTTVSPWISCSEGGIADRR